MSSPIPAHDHGLTDPVEPVAPRWLQPLLDRVDDRAGLRVDDEGIEVRRLLRSRRIRWAQVESVRLDSRLDAVLAAALRFVPVGRVPLIGGWLVETGEQVVAAATRRLAPGLRDAAGWTVATIERTGVLRPDADVDGGAHLTALCHPGLAETVVAQASMRHIPVERA
jgi:hypothetical protein